MRIIKRGIHIVYICVSFFVFFTVLFGGNIIKQNYNNRSPLTAWLTVLFVILGIVLWLNLHRWIKKRTVLSMDRIIIILSILLFGIQVFIYYNIFFKTGWDVSAIEAGARVLSGETENTIWLSSYFGTYPNNIFLTWFYCFTLKIGEILGLAGGENIQMVFIVMNCIISSIAAWLTYWCVKQINSIHLAVLAFLGVSFSVCLSPWTSIPYSDPLVVFIPITIYALYLKLSIDRKKTWLWILMSFLGMIGYHTKPQAVILFIAVFIADFIRGMKEKDKKGLAIIILLCVIGIIAGEGVHKIAYKEFDKRIPISEESAFSLWHWAMMGLNEETNGRYNQSDVDFSRSFVDEKERIAAQKGVIEQRIKKYGPAGYLQLLGKKTALCFSDGTFSWSTGAGDFYNMVYEEKGVLSSALRDIFYYHGKWYPVLSTIQQLIWMAVLLLCAVSGIRKNFSDMELVLFLMFIGCVLFELFFEIFPRHLYCNVPCFMVLAMTGMGNLEHFSEKVNERGIIGKKKKLAANIVLVAILLVLIAQAGFQSDLKYIIKRAFLKTLELPMQDEVWNLADYMDSDYILVNGKMESEDYPYGYNIGVIEDNAVGRAVLITPNTSVEFKAQISKATDLRMDFAIHPWVAENSDGAIINISVDSEKDEETYSYDVSGAEKEAVIDLNDYIGRKVLVRVWISNAEENNENCDWMILQNFSFAAGN